MARDCDSFSFFFCVFFLVCYFVHHSRSIALFKHRAPCLSRASHENEAPAVIAIGGVAIKSGLNDLNGAVRQSQPARTMARLMSPSKSPSDNRLFANAAFASVNFESGASSAIKLLPRRASQDGRAAIDGKKQQKKASL